MNIIFYVAAAKICPYCFNDTLVYDERRDETYCSECGLIVKDGSLITPDGYDNHEIIENFRHFLYSEHDKKVVDKVIWHIFNQ